MKLINLDQQIFVPIVDETNGGATYEMQMTVGEFFDKCCPGFRPEAVEAVPVEWLLQKAQQPTATEANPFRYTLETWREEQEAR